MKTFYSVQYMSTPNGLVTVDFTKARDAIIAYRALDSFGAKDLKVLRISKHRVLDITPQKG